MGLSGFQKNDRYPNQVNLLVTQIYLRNCGLASKTLALAAKLGLFGLEGLVLNQIQYVVTCK